MEMYHFQVILLGAKKKLYKGYYYKGEWRNGKYHGQGIETRPNGSFYKGEWEESLCRGNGELFLTDGTHVVANFHAAGFDGKVHFRYKNVRSFIGNFQNGAANGFGVLVYRHGKKKYRGNFINGYAHGPKGKVTWPDGTISEGEYKVGFKIGMNNYQYPIKPRYTRYKDLDGKQHYNFQVNCKVELFKMRQSIPAPTEENKDKVKIVSKLPTEIIDKIFDQYLDYEPIEI